MRKAERRRFLHTNLELMTTGNIKLLIGEEKASQTMSIMWLITLQTSQVGIEVGEVIAL